MPVEFDTSTSPRQAKTLATASEEVQVNLLPLPLRGALSRVVEAAPKPLSAAHHPTLLFVCFSLRTAPKAQPKHSYGRQTQDHTPRQHLPRFDMMRKGVGFGTPTPREGAVREREAAPAASPNHTTNDTVPPPPPPILFKKCVLIPLGGCYSPLVPWYFPRPRPTHLFRFAPRHPPPKTRATKTGPQKEVDASC